MFSSPMAADTNWRERRRRARGRRCFRDAPCVGDAADTSGSDMPRGEEDWRLGTSATAHAVMSVTHSASRSQAVASMKLIGALVVETMTPAAIELALEIRREIEARHEEADRLHLRAIERARIEADFAQRRYMLVDPSNRLVADTLEGEWNDRLRALTKAQEERERARQESQVVLDEAIRDRLVAMTTDFKALWRDPTLPNRERKRLLAYLIEDVTLVKVPAEGITRIHVRFKGGRTETLTTQNPKSSAQQVKTRPEVVELVDALLDNHTYPEIADILNDRGLRPGGSARRGQAGARFTALRVAYLAHEYELRSRYDRLRSRGMLTRPEAAARLGICESTLMRWVEHGLVARHAYNAHAHLYEAPGPNPPAKHCSRWDRLVDRAAANRTAVDQSSSIESKEMQYEAK